MSEDLTGETEALAAEYVLGTLDLEARKAAESLRVRDPEFAAKVKIWERRLGELHLMVEPVEPDPEIWLGITAKLPVTKSPEPISAIPEPVVAVPERERKPEPAGPSEAAPPTASALAFTAAEQQADERQPAEPESAEPKSDEPKSDEPKSDEPKSEERKAADSKLESELAIAPAPETAASEAAPATGVSFSDVTLSEAQADANRVPSFDVSAAAASAVADALAAPEPEAATAAVPTDANVAPEANLRVTERHLAFWRAAALVMALALLSAAALVSLWRYVPDRVPAELRPLALMRLVGIAIDTSVPQRKPAPPESRFDE